MARVIGNLTERILFYESKMREEEQNEDLSDTEEFVKAMRNDNTQKMTKSTYAVLIKFLRERGENREPEKIPPGELDKQLASFYMKAKKSDGSDYEPSSMTNMMCSINRYLKEHHYPENIHTGQSFSHSREVLVAKRKLLKARGLGNKKNRAAPFEDEELDKMYALGLLGQGK